MQIVATCYYYYFTGENRHLIILMYLSKTRILAGLHCEKRLYFMLNRPELAKTKKSPLAESGIAVGRQARKEFSAGVLVNRFQADSNPFSETNAYLNDENVPAIFEEILLSPGYERLLEY